MFELIVNELRYDVWWNGCDVEVQTTIDFWNDLRADDLVDSMELVVEDRVCAEDLEHHADVWYKCTIALVADWGDDDE